MSDTNTKEVRGYCARCRVVIFAGEAFESRVPVRSRIGIPYGEVGAREGTVIRCGKCSIASSGKFAFPNAVIEWSSAKRLS